MTCGGAFLLSAAQSAFNNELIKAFATKLPEIDPIVALGVGATQIRRPFTAAQIPLVIEAYTLLSPSPPSLDSLAAGRGCIVTI